MYPGGDAGGPTVPHHFYMVVEAVVLHGFFWWQEPWEGRTCGEGRCDTSSTFSTWVTD